ncbi:ATP-binding protein [bacterium]|nr:ATP-binding protein [bacterium]
MQEDITILETLEELASVLQDGSRKRIREEMRAAASVVDPGCSEEELAALAILVRETRRGNEVVTMLHLRACAKHDYRMSVRWDVVLGALAERELVAVLTEGGETETPSTQLRSLLRERASTDLRVGLRLRDPSYDPALAADGYRSNQQYLRDCFDYIERYADSVKIRRERRRMRHEEPEKSDDLDGRYTLLRRRAAESDPLPPLERLAQQLELSRLEWTFILYTLAAELESDTPEVRDLVTLGGNGILERFETRQYFEDGGTLVSAGILELHGDFPTPQLDVSLNDDISRWLLSDGDMPDIAGGGSKDEPTPFASNEEYVTGWMNVVRVLIGDNENMPLHMRRRRRRNGSGIPATEHPAFSSFARRVRCTEACYPLEQMSRDAGLDTNERILLAIGVYMALRDGAFDLSNATALLAGGNLFERLRMKQYFAEDAPLLREGLIEIEEGFMASRDFTVPQDVLHRIIADESVTGKDTVEKVGMSFFERRTPGHTLSEAVLPSDLVDNLGDALGAVSGELQSLLRSWGVESITAGRQHGSLLMLFSGPAGTGKTFTAEAFAGALGRELFITDAGKLLSSWYGRSERNMQQMFRHYARHAKKADKAPVLLLNECDQLLMTRSAESSRSTDQTEHRLQNILLEELERFPGILIATTNLVETMDDAFSRRFDYKLVFPMPDRGTRLALWLTHIPAGVPLSDDLNLPALALRFAFSGGQIAVAAANALRIAARRGDCLMQSDLLHACQLEEEGRFDRTPGSGSHLGFHADNLN